MKIDKKRTFLSLLLISALLPSSAFLIFCVHSRSFSKENQLEKREPNPREGKPRVALIGDSWIAGDDLDPHILEFLGEKGWDVELDSFGHSGARSKRIYQNLFDEDSPYSSSFVLFGESPYDLVVIVAGVNDSAGYMGSDFYAYHMGLIIKALHERGSVPVIVELPEYGIEDTNSNNPVGYIRRPIFRHLFNDSKIDVIPDCRKELKGHLEQNHANINHLYVDFDQISSDYKQSLSIYRDDVIHLNEEGNRKLSEAIVADIDQWLTRRWSQRR